MIKEIEGVAYDTADPDQKKEYRRHYYRVWKQNNPDKIKAYEAKYCIVRRERRMVEKEGIEAQKPKPQMTMKKVKSAIFNYIKYNYDEVLREAKKEAVLQHYYNKKEEVKKVRISFD